MSTATKSRSGSGNRRTSNPAFGWAYQPKTDVAEPSATVAGTVFWTVFYLAIMCVTGGYVWSLTLPQATGIVVQGGDLLSLPANVYGYLIGGCLGGFVIALFTIFNPRLSPFTVPFYAACEGLCLGALSAGMEYAYPGIVLQTVGITLGCMLSVLTLYATGVIKVNETFKMVLLTAMLGIVFVYLADILVRLCFNVNVPFVHETGWAGIGFSLVVCVVAALNFAWDADNIREAVEAKAPKYYECYLAFGLLLTLVWLYLEVMRLLGKLRSSD